MRVYLPKNQREEGEEQDYFVKPIDYIPFVGVVTYGWRNIREVEDSEDRTLIFKKLFSPKIVKRFFGLCCWSSFSLYVIHKSGILRTIADGLESLFTV